MKNLLLLQYMPKVFSYFIQVHRKNRKQCFINLFPEICQKYKLLIFISQSITWGLKLECLIITEIYRLKRQKVRNGIGHFSQSPKDHDRRINRPRHGHISTFECRLKMGNGLVDMRNKRISLMLVLHRWWCNIKFFMEMLPSLIRQCRCLCDQRCVRW